MEDRGLGGPPRLLVIGGHPRSGTTLLWHLCNEHPEIKLTYEFNNFASIGEPWPDYRRKMLTYVRSRGLLRNRVLRLLESRNRFRQVWRMLTSFAFIGRYLHRLPRRSGATIDLAAIEETLRSLLPAAAVVGDKYPAYLWSMDQFVRHDDLHCVVVYRDCRDVASSTLERVRTDWRSMAFARRMDTAGKIAARWVQAAEIQERHAGIQAIRYEDLIENPRQPLAKLAAALRVDPDGFPTQLIRRGSIGKYRKGLTEKELATVLETAGPTMRRLGYEF